METKLDKRDLQVLYWLDVNARLTYSELGKKLRISKQVAKYRIERLEQEKIIRGYHPMIDLSRLGYITFRVYLKFRNLTPPKKQEIIEYLKNQEKIWAVVHVAGQWDMALGISVKGIYDYYDVWEAFLKKYLHYLKDYKVSVYSPIYHYAKAYLIEKEDNSPIRTLGGNEQVSADQKDMKILAVISKNAAVSLLDISKVVKMSPELVSYRMKQMEKKGIIQGYRAAIDVEQLGYQFYKTEIRLSRYDSIKEVLAFCHQHPHIYQVDKTIGGETIEIEFHVKNLRQMYDIIEEMEEKFKGIIESFTYLTILQEEKTTYFPIS